MQEEPLRDARLIGIGGWLLLLVIKLSIGTVVRLLAGIAESNHLVGLLNLAFALVGGVSAYLLVIKSPKGVLLAKIVLGGEAVYYLLEVVPPISVANPFKTAGFFCVSVLYLAYLFRSKRVKNTYFPMPPSLAAQANKSGIA
jgi:hypothetical protein